MDHKQDSEQSSQLPLQDNDLPESGNENMFSSQGSPEKDWSEGKKYQEPHAPMEEESETSEDFYEISHPMPGPRITKTEIVLWTLRSALLLNVVVYLAVLYLGASTELVQASSPEAMRFFVPKNAEVQSLVFESSIHETEARKRLSQAFAQGIDLYGSGPKGLGQ